MLRNLNQTYAGGERRLGLCTTGVLGSAIPSSGTSGPAWMYPSMRPPATNTREYSYWIEAHTFPGGLPPGDDSAGAITGLPDGVYAAAVALYEWDVYVGAFPVLVTVGAGATFAQPQGVAVVYDATEPPTAVLQAPPPAIGGTPLA